MVGIYFAEGKEVRGLHGQIGEWAQNLVGPRADISIALRVIGRRNAEQRKAEARWGKNAKPNDNWVFDEEKCPQLAEHDGPTTTLKLESYLAKLKAWKARIGENGYRGFRLDLRKTCLQGADLSDLCFSGAILHGVRIEGANLNRVRLEGSQIFDASLDGATMTSAHMEGAILWRVGMEGATLTGATMNAAEIIDVRIFGADWNRAKLQGAHLYNVRIEHSNFWDAKMQGATLHHTRLIEVILSDAHLGGANLGWKCLLWAIDLHRTMLSKACIHDSDITNVAVSLEIINSMFGDASDKLPQSITPEHDDWPGHWPKESLFLNEFNTAYQSWLSSQP